MPITGKDSLAEASAGVHLTAHTPSGAGAAGGAWTDGTTTGNQFVSLVSNAGFVGTAAVACSAVQAGIETASNNSVQANINASGSGFIGGAQLFNRTSLGTAGTPDGYAMVYDGVLTPGFRLVKVFSGGTYFDLATVSGGPTFTTAADYLLEVQRVVNSPSSCTVTGWINGVQVAQGTDTGANAGGLWSDIQSPGLFSYLGNVCTFTLYQANTVAAPDTSSASPNDLPSNHNGTISVVITKSSPTLTSSTTWTASGVAGWSVASKVNNSTTQDTVVLNCPAVASPPAGATGTLSLTEGVTGSTVATIAIHTPTLAISPTSGGTGTTPTLTCTGTHTIWQRDTGVALFSVTGGTGASVADATVATNNNATAPLTVGSGSGTLTVKDTSIGSTASFTAGVAPVTILPNDSRINYYGRWNVSSSVAISINSGSVFEFAYTGDTCTLNFDMTGVTYGPDVWVTVDGVRQSRVSIAGGSLNISVAPTYTSSGNVKSSDHVVIMELAGVYEGTDANSVQTTVDQWNSRAAAARLVSITLDHGEDLLAFTKNPNLIEFIGDSTVASIRTLWYSGFAGGSTQKAMDSMLGWPHIVAANLGMRPITTGFGGTGITTGGSGGVPATGTSFPLIYAGVNWTPAVKPKAVVLYVGINDSVLTQAEYLAFIQQVRAAYPACYIFACVQHGQSAKLAAISGAVTASADAKAFLIDASSVISSSPDTTDGTHLNPGGDAKLGAFVASSIATTFNSLGVVIQPPGGNANIVFLI